MSEEVRIIITDDTEDESTPVSSPQSGASSTAMPPKDEKGAEKAKRSGSSSMGLVAIRKLAPFISQAVNFSVSQIEITTGNAESQRKAQVLSSMAGTGMSLIVAGLSSGVGGVITTGGMAAMQGITAAAQRSVEIENQKRLEYESLVLRKSRLGISTNRSRTGGVS